jgi:tetratricopeptide (TPR) repeat protein
VGSGFVALGDFDSASDWHSYYAEAFPEAAEGLELAIQLAVVAGEYEDAAKLAEQALTYSADTVNLPNPLYVLRNRDIRQKKYTQALTRYGEFFPELTTTEPIVHRSNVMAAVDLIPVLRGSGDDDRADRMATIALGLLQSMPRNGFVGSRTLKAEVLALMGNKPAALAALRESIDSGWMTYWLELPDRNPNFESLHDDPEFKALLDEVRSRIAIELDKTRELASAGKLAMRPEQLGEINFDLEL